MKNASHRFRTPSHREIVQYKFKRLKELINDELVFGVPSYEDGSLSPKHGLVEIFNKIQELDNLMNQRVDNIRLSQQAIPPPATPESLDDISEAIE